MAIKLYHCSNIWVKVQDHPWYPVIQFEDGSVYREESKEIAATIRAGKLDEKRGGSR
jgi:hypothetical protein